MSSNQNKETEQVKDELVKMIAINYKNATVVKLKNKRVAVKELDDMGEKTIGLCFKILTSVDDAKIPSACHKVSKGVLKTTTIRISKSAALALFHCLQRQLQIVYKTQTP